MKNIAIIVGVCWILGSCVPKDCHTNINLQNHSTDTILVALEFTYYDSCGLAYKYRLAPGESAQFPTRTCWEEAISSTNPLDLYILPKDEPNNYHIKYECDSFLNKYNILRHYHITLDTLVQNNFTITYP